jgi:hypothetical protein
MGGMATSADIRDQLRAAALEFRARTLDQNRALYDMLLLLIGHEAPEQFNRLLRVLEDRDKSLEEAQWRMWQAINDSFASLQADSLRRRSKRGR